MRSRLWLASRGWAPVTPYSVSHSRLISSSSRWPSRCTDIRPGPCDLPSRLTTSCVPKTSQSSSTQRTFVTSSLANLATTRAGSLSCKSDTTSRARSPLGCTTVANHRVEGDSVADCSSAGVKKLASGGAAGAGA
jgi:hypothetical protein